MSSIFYPVCIAKEGLPKKGGYYLFSSRKRDVYVFFSPLSKISLAKVKPCTHWYRKSSIEETTKTNVKTLHQRALNHWKMSKNFHLNNDIVRMGVLDNLFRDAILNAYKSGANE